MDINSIPLKAYRHYTETIEGLDNFDQWLIHGDYMELVSTRDSLADAAETLNERETELLEELDARLAEVLTDGQIEELAEDSPELAIKEWWR